MDITYHPSHTEAKKKRPEVVMVEERERELLYDTSEKNVLCV